MIEYLKETENGFETVLDLKNSTHVEKCECCGKTYLAALPTDALE